MAHPARRAGPTRVARILCGPAVVAAALAGLHLVATDSAAAGVTVANPSFESWASGLPSCWQLGGVGTGSATITASATAHSGSHAALLTVTSLASSSNRKIVVDQHTSSCAPTAVPGHKYKLTTYVRSNVSSRMVVYYRDTAGTWHWWAQGSTTGSTSSWRALSITTSALPAGANAISFGPIIEKAGWLLADDASMTDQSLSTVTSPAPTTASGSPTTTASASPTTASASPTPTAASPSPTPTTGSPTPTPTTGSPTPTPPAPSGPVVSVSTASALSGALTNAQPGQTIALADGTYSGNFTLSRSGTATAPIRITGSRNAKLVGSSVSSGYVLHLDNASYVTLDGFSITNGQKALVLDQSTHDTITNLDAYHTGEEVVLLRNYSSDNVVSYNQVHDSGHTTAGYGEGIYVGLAVSNWSSSGQSRTGGGPDTSDRNQIIGNHVYGTTAENVDIKEGTSNGLVEGNSFDSTGMTGANYADSWVDIAGNGWTIRGNAGVNPGSALLDGYQTHVMVSGWACNNVFDGNTSAVNAGGYAINIQTSGTGNVVKASNTETGAAKGLTNITVTP